MSLQVWLPLTKDLRNQGLSNVTITNYGATLDNNGKLGKCYYFDGTDDRITVSGLSLPNVWSYSCWIYSATSSRSWEAIIMLNSTGGDSDLQLGFYTYPSGNRIQNTANGQYNSGIAWTYGMWHHFCGTFDGSNLKTYIDGVLVDTKDITASLLSRTNLTIGARSTNAANTTAGTFFQGRLNDVRIYDHCLSQMEVKELAKGLVLHYPLNRNGWGQNNLIITNSMAPASGTSGWSSAGTDWANSNVVSSGASNGHAIRCTYSGTAQVSGGIHHPTGVDKTTLTNGATYTLSARIRASKACVATFYNELMPTSNTINLTTDWKTYSYSCAIDNTRTYQSNVIYVRAADATQNMWIECDWIKLEEGTKATPWCPNSSDTLATTMGLNSTTECDCSGFCNNGNKSSNTISYTSDTPKYTVSTQLIGTTVDTTSNTKTGAAYITGPCSLSNITALTVSWWAKIKQYGRGGIMDLTAVTSNYEEGTDYNTCPLSNWDSTFRLWDGTNAFNFFSHVLKDSTWHHYVITFTSGSGKFYRDGVNVANSGTMGNTLTNFNGIRIGLGKAGGVYRQIKEDISDIRIYATALSADEVKSLYQNSAYIDSSGNIYGAIHMEA